MRSFKAYVGGHFGPSYTVEADISKRLVKYTHWEDGVPHPDSFDKPLTDEIWACLVKGLADCGFERWLEDYTDPETLDGTQWSVEIRFASGQRTVKGGSNDFPGTWESFCAMVCDLAGAEFS
jgi:hypothetical protein